MTMTAGIDRREALVTAGVALTLSSAASAQAQRPQAQGPQAGLAERVAIAEDAVAVENLMGLYPLLMHAGLYEQLLSRFALSRPDVRVEVRGVGSWEGSAAVQKALVLIPEQVDRDFGVALQRQFPNVWLEPRAGRQFEMPLASAVIHVAKDGRTAKGLWSAWGAQTGVGRDGRIAALWVAEKYAVDFVKEDGAWKFWHFQIAPVFRTPYEVSWTEAAGVPWLPQTYWRGMLAPNKPSKAVAHAYDPRPPEPFATFAKTWSY